MTKVLSSYRRMPKCYLKIDHGCFLKTRHSYHSVMGCMDQRQAETEIRIQETQDSFLGSDLGYPDRCLSQFAVELN